MPSGLFTPEQSLSLKLESTTVGRLKRLCAEVGVSAAPPKPKMIERLLKAGITHSVVNAFIKREYAKRIRRREALITTEELRRELLKVTHFDWGIVQGRLDGLIQSV